MSNDPAIAIVCGGRDYKKQRDVWDALQTINTGRGLQKIIHGGASGADAHAASYANALGVPVQAFQADWDSHGKAAGPIRNQQMIDEGHPNLVVAFPGGRGTANMMKLARAAGLSVWQPMGETS